MRIAIIGAGISGLTAAHLLHSRHEVTLFESGDHVGGHAHTVDVEVDGDQQAIDTGFIVYNDWTYPNFIGLLDELQVESQATEMSFSVRCDRTGVEYCGSNLNGLFAQRRNLLRPRFHRLLSEILRFNREAPRLLQASAEEVLVGEYLRERGYGREFIEQYLVPMGSAIWSCPAEKFEKFPMRFIVEFFHNHGLLSIFRRPTWRTIRGGSREYVQKLIRPFRDRIRLKSTVTRVSRSPGAVTLVVPGDVLHFEHVIFACHSDQALRMLADPTRVEQELLGAFPYEPNVVVLHTDASVLPRSRRAWAAWNYHVPRESAGKATVTYNMNILQRLQSRQTYCVTLNEEARIDPARVLLRQVYHHPVFTARRREAQRRQGDLLAANRTSFCGAYWGNGFHEDGVNSARAVCAALERQEQSCTAVSMKGEFVTGDSHLCDTSSATACS